ncbi:hypothetical protein ACWDTT_02780 [Streptosporangium sandarakinum]|uniref:hypothetical protein n=1 Tax=Streptosporangium TaxID=2000 RepID=UPI0031F884CA
MVPDDYGAEADFAVTAVPCADRDTRARSRTLASLPPHRCAEPRARLFAYPETHP